mgnify:FL=1|jgi:replicative DNA helicase
MSEPIFNTEAEAGLLACLMDGGSDCYHDAVGLGIRMDWFYDLRHRAIFRAIQELELEGKPALLVSVKIKLEHRIKDAGGLDYLASIPDFSPSAALLPHFAELCKGTALRRKAAAIATEGLELANGTAEGRDALKRILERCTDALDESETVESHTGAGLATAFLDSLERLKALADAGKRSGLVTGLLDVDRMTDGIQLGEQTIIAARPSSGKTAIGLTILEQMVFANEIPSLVISCEMSKEALTHRLCAIHTGVPLSCLRRGTYTEAEFKRIEAFNKRLANAPLFIHDGISGVTGGQASAIIRQHARRHGVRFVLVDYLQKLRPDRKGEKRTYEIGEISNALRSAAVSSRVALISLAQINRDSEKGNEPRVPRLCDIADSAQIERDADTVMMLHRDRTKPADALLVVAKQRDGETGNINLLFDGPTTKFKNLEHEHPQD